MVDSKRVIRILLKLILAISCFVLIFEAIGTWGQNFNGTPKPEWLSPAVVNAAALSLIASVVFLVFLNWKNKKS